VPNRLSLNLPAINEVTENSISSHNSFRNIDNKGVLAGIELTPAMIEPMSRRRITNCEFDKIKLKNLDFVFLEPEEEQKQMESIIYDKVVSTTRWEDEFSKNDGIKCIRGKFFPIV
jgi:hypothetical protein